MSYLIQTFEEDHENKLTVATYQIMQENKKPVITGSIKELLPVKEINGPKDNYRISSFIMDVNWSGKTEQVVFSAFKSCGAIVDTLEVGDNVSVECYPSSKVFEDKNHRTIMKVSHIKKNF